MRIKGVHCEECGKHMSGISFVYRNEHRKEACSYYCSERCLHRAVFAEPLVRNRSRRWALALTIAVMMVLMAFVARSASLWDFAPRGSEVLSTFSCHALDTRERGWCIVVASEDHYYMSFYQDDSLVWVRSIPRENIDAPFTVLYDTSPGL